MATAKEKFELAQPRYPQMLFRMRLPKQAPAVSILRHAGELSAE